jgi:hypothetical protein
MNAPLSATQKDSVNHIAGLVLINAMIFQEILADHEGRVHNLQKILAKQNLLDEFSKQWQFIVGQIDYYPIFHLASEILSNLTANKDIIESVRSLAQTPPVRAEIDASIADALHLPNFAILRERLAQEPVVCMRRL